MHVNIYVYIYVYISTITSIFFPHVTQASQLGVYKAFVDNYKVALETAEKCSHANIQFQKISEVCLDLHPTTSFTLLALF